MQAKLITRGNILDTAVRSRSDGALRMYPGRYNLVKR